MIPILSVVGRSKSGKTTLLEKLIRELAARGRRVGTIKHHYHGPVTVDVPGKDSWRHREAGARAVALLSPETLFVVRDTPEALSLESLAYRAFFGVDLILTEGFKSGPTPKIEVNRKAQNTPLLCGSADRLAAVVSDWDTGAPVPHFGLDDTARLADFIEQGYCQPSERPGLELLVGGRRRTLEPRREADVVRVLRSLLNDSGDPADGSSIELRIPGHTP